MRQLTIDDFLNDFLALSSCPPHTMNLYQLDGYLRAVACISKPLKKETWYPLIFNDDVPSYRDAEQASQVATAIENLYQYHVMQNAEGECDLPFQPQYSETKTLRVDQEQWARGFMQGYILTEAWWNCMLEHTTAGVPDVTQKSHMEDVDEALQVIFAVADADLAQLQGMTAEHLSSAFEQLPTSVITLAQIGEALCKDQLANNICSATLD